MKREQKLSMNAIELTTDETKAVTGGFTIIDTVKCVRGSLLSGNGTVRTLLLGLSIWGMARMAGAACECAG